MPVHQQDELNHLRSSSVSPQLPPPTSTTTRALSLPTSRTLNQRPPGLGNTFPEKSGNKNLSEKSSEKRDRVPDGGGRGGGNRGLRSPPGARRGFDRIISWTWRASRFTFRCPAASAPRRVAPMSRHLVLSPPVALEQSAIHSTTYQLINVAGYNTWNNIVKHIPLYR